MFVRKKLTIAFLLLAALVFIAVDALLIWVATGPRHVPALTPYIEEAFTARDGSYSVTIGDTRLAWGSFRHPVDVRLRDVRILTKNQAVFSSFSEISIGIDILSLPLGRVLPTSVTLDAPTIALTQNEDKSISFGFGKYESIVPETPAEQTPIPEVMATPAPPRATTVPFAAVLAPLLNPESSGKLRSLHRVTIRNAGISIGNAKQGVFFELAGANIQAKRRGDEVTLLVGGNMLYGDRQSAIRAAFSMSGDAPTIEGDIKFDRLEPGALGRLFADNPAFRIFNAPLSGKTHLSLNKDGGISRLLFDIKSDAGYITSDLLADSVPVNAAHITGQISNDGRDIQIDALSAVMGKIELSGSGVVSLNNNDAAVRGHLALRNATAADTKLLWPPSLAPESRIWIIDNIRHGQVPHAEARLNIQFGDLAKPVLPREAVDASISLEDATIRYLPEHPPVSKVSGVVRIDGVGLTADIAAADFLQSTKLSAGKLDIEDLNADNPYIKISFSAATTARDAVDFLKLPRLQRAKALNLNSDTAQGAATLKASLGFLFYAPPGEEPDIAYDVIADLTNLSSPGFLNKFDIKNGNGALTVNNQSVRFKGSGNVNGASASQADVIYKFSPEEGFDTLIDVTGQAPIESAVRFGYPAMPFAKGTLGVKASLKLGPEQEESSAVIDLTHAALNVAALGWLKPEQEPATLEIKARKQSESMKVSSFTLSGKDVEATGSATIAKGFSGIEQLSLGKTKVGNTELHKLEYAYAGNNLRVDVSGKSLDLSAWMEDDSESSEFSFANFPAVAFKADIAQLTLSKRAGIRNFKGEMTCDAKRCQNAEITGLTGDSKEFTLRILKNPKGKRQFSLHAADAGMFLKAFGASEPDIEGGTLSISGNYDELSVGSILHGKMVISNYTVRKAPVLARILSLASFTGVLDLLQGGGISFSKLNAPFTLQNDIVKFEKAKAYGGSIGITADGTVQFPKRMMDLSGTVVPAYALNNMIGKVPLVGPLLTGGGAGVIGFDYRVKGTAKEPDVSVNPLSLLTPGFLRNLFSGGE